MTPTPVPPKRRQLWRPNGRRLQDLRSGPAPPINGEPVPPALLLEPIVVLLVDLEVARISVGVPVCGRLELPRGAVFQPIVLGHVEPLPASVDEPKLH